MSKSKFKAIRIIFYIEWVSEGQAVKKGIQKETSRNC